MKFLPTHPRKFPILFNYTPLFYFCKACFNFPTKKNPKFSKQINFQNFRKFLRNWIFLKKKTFNLQPRLRLTRVVRKSRQHLIKELLFECFQFQPISGYMSFAAGWRDVQQFHLLVFLPMPHSYPSVQIRKQFISLNYHKFKIR